MSAEIALLAAIRAHAIADAGVQGVLGASPRFHDERPPNPMFPFVTIGQIETRPADAAGAPTSEHVAALHIWSRQGGRREALEAIAALRAALHDAALTLDGFRLVLLRATFSDVFRDGDGRTIHGVLRLRAITEPM